MSTRHKSRIIARFGIFFLFLSFGIWEIIDPAYWIGFAPSFIAKSASALLLVKVHGITLSIIGAGILFSKHVRFFAFLATAVMVQIIASLWIASGFSDILVRDIAILIFAFSLIF
ncbi:MAG: hypothetical protein KGJ58_03905 [Patescibacteria group bacterium]|nr:hypothetical protein [Patescibacteria group bacterium]MDE1988451.1 hypothetical protein [Patescibacteria group bacterium]MDE2218568.1 hypothetical protein [Patescibacteria group bacterium]